VVPIALLRCTSFQTLDRDFVKILDFGAFEMSPEHAVYLGERECLSWSLRSVHHVIAQPWGGRFPHPGDQREFVSDRVSEPLSGDSVGAKTPGYRPSGVVRCSPGHHRSSALQHRLTEVKADGSPVRGE